MNSTWQQSGRNLGLEREMFGGMNTGINFDKYDNIPVEMKGANVPPMINEFNDLRFHQWITDNIALSGYTKPTPVQKGALPVALSGRDLMACAQTGSGKTAAFLLPIIQEILQRGPGGVTPKQTRLGRTCQFPAALILAPTRELSIQIYQEACKFTYRMPISVAILYGGQENRKEQVEKLRALRSCSILVATPGRLTDIMNNYNVALNCCRYLVLDEADRMLDMGFEPQIRAIVSGSGMPQPGQRRTMMFSATFPSTIQQLARDFLDDHFVFLTVGRVGSTSENIIQDVQFVEDWSKKGRVMDLLDQYSDGLTLIFTETKRSAADLTTYLYRQAYDTVAIHGDMTQTERERNLASFRSGKTPILVATNVAARGLDIPHVKHVINYDLPGDIDDYVHRIGRTGRVGNVGRATSLYNERNINISRQLVQLLEECKQEVPGFLMQSYRGRGGGRSTSASVRSSYAPSNGFRNGAASGSSNGFTNGMFMSTASGSSNGFTNGICNVTGRLEALYFGKK